MPRPKKWRRVCSMPRVDAFGPLSNDGYEKEPVVMTVEEFETIRLIDKEGLMQEDCADQMDVARTTVQRIYFEARKKIAEALVEGKNIIIEGGNYKVCSKYQSPCGCPHCKRNLMKVQIEEVHHE